MAKYSKKIFREYDIRGIYGQDFDDEFAALLAKALIQFYGKSKPKVAVGRDARNSGVSLSQAFMQSLAAHGAAVVDLGLVPTPLVYFSNFKENIELAVSITGSHNPPPFNGFKICINESTLHGEQIQELFKICEKIKGESLPRSDVTRFSTIPIEEIYVEEISKQVKLKRKLKVVVDAGNGAAWSVAPKLLQRIGCEVIPLFCDADGTFPNHHPDPTVIENLDSLRKTVLQQQADLGVAFDGDADRIGVVDEKGTPIYGDELLILFSREILSRKPGATIISEVKSSKRLFSDIEKRGGRAIMWKTGHSLIKAKMKAENAELAGEMSGHMFFKDRYYGFDDAVYAAARLVEILSSDNLPLSELLLDLPPVFNTPEIRVDCADEEKFELVNEVKQSLAKRFHVIDIDGVRIETPRGWGLLRASNTQPVIVMRFEAETEEDLLNLRNTVESEVESARKK